MNLYDRIKMTGQPRRHWTDEMVLDELRALHERGVPMTCNGVKQADSRLFGAVFKHFGTLGKALESAGIAKTRNTKWNEEKVIAEIGRLREDGVDLRASRIAYSHKSLHWAAIKYCASWDNAMSLAGVRSGEYCRKLGGPKLRRTGEEMLEGLIALHDQSVEMSVRGIGTADNKLYRACRKHFGNIGIALEKAGLTKVESPRKRPHRTDEEIIMELKQLYDCGEPVNARALQLNHSALAYVLRRRFGSYDAALRAAGLDPAKIRKG